MRYLFTCILYISLISCYQQERFCTDFTNGTFEFTTIIDSVENKTKFVRNGNIQVEYFNNKVDTATVNWVNDCEFILKKINPKTMAERKAIQMKILTTTEDSYTFEYGIVGQPNKQRGTAKKIN